jgi:hypothetical protein
MRHVPIRACMGCGERHPQAQLLRLFVRLDGSLDTDPLGKAGGRGAYLCMKVDCLWEARQKNRFARAFRRSMSPVDEGALAMRIAERLREYMLRRLHTARRAGAVLPGPSGPVLELSFGEMHAVGVADGCEAPRGEFPVFPLGAREGLALALQAPQASFAAILTGEMAKELCHLASVRADFLRPPPPRQTSRIGRRAERVGEASCGSFLT